MTLQATVTTTWVITGTKGSIVENTQDTITQVIASALNVAVDYALVNGFPVTIPIPTGTSRYVILPINSDATQQLTLKGTTGDAGNIISAISDTEINLAGAPAPPSNFVLLLNGTGITVRVIFL